MKTTVTLCILYKTVPIYIKLPTICKILVCTLSEIIFIYKIISRIIWRIYVYHLNFSKICFL